MNVNPSRREMMFIQTWQGIALQSNANQLQNLLFARVLPLYQSAAGSLGAYLCREDNGGLANFLLLSLWSSRDALVRFAGPGMDMLVLSPEERKLLLAFESRARNFEVLQLSQPQKGR